MLTPNGLSVRSRIRLISSRMTSSSPDEVSMIPMAPAFDTAEARSAVGDPPHRGLDDRDVDPEKLGHSVPEHGRTLAVAEIMFSFAN